MGMQPIRFQGNLGKAWSGASSFAVSEQRYDDIHESCISVQGHSTSSVTLKFSVICYITESKHNNEQEVPQMLEVDDKAMAYYLIEALFAGGYINNPTYQNFLQMKHEQKEEEPPAKAS